MTHVNVRGRSALIAGGVGAALVLAAAANGASAAPTPAPKASTASVACAPTPGVDNSSIKLGIVFPKSVVSYAGFDSAAKLRIDQQNAKGGINGRKLVISTYDDAANAATQVTVANKAIQQDEMFGIMSASTVDTMYNTLKTNNVPVTGLPNLPAYTTDRNTFGVYGPYTPNLSSTVLGDKFKDLGATNIATLNHVSPAATASGNAFVAIEPLSGLTNSLRITDLPLGTYDATSTALRIRQTGSDGVNAVLLPEGGVSLGQALKQQGVTLKAYTIPALTDPALVAKAGAAVEGVFSAPYGTVPVDVNKPAVRTYKNGMKAAGLNPYLSFAPLGFVAADLMIKGLQLAGKCPTRQGFIDNLRKLDKYDGAGMLPGSVGFAPSVYSPLGHGPGCTWYVTIKNGYPVPDAKPICGKTIDLATMKVIG